MLVRVDGGLPEEEFRGCAAEPVAWLAYRGQRDSRCPNEADVVIADDRQVVGHVGAGPEGVLQQSHGYQVVGAERRSGAARHGDADQALAHGASARDVEGARVEEREVLSRMSGLSPRLSSAGEAVPHLRGCGAAARECDSPVPSVDEVPDGDASSEDVVDRNSAERGAGSVPLEDDYGRSEVLQLHQGGRGRGRRG